MFIYILNLLNDGIKKQNKYKFSNVEIIKDAKYISTLAGVKKSLDFENFSNKIIEIFELLNKYNLTAKDSVEILNKLILNENNSWILETVSNKNYENIKNKPKFVLSSAINNMLEKSKFKENHIKTNYKRLETNNIEKIEDYYVKIKHSKLLTRAYVCNKILIRNKEKIYELAE